VKFGFPAATVTVSCCKQIQVTVGRQHVWFEKKASKSSTVAQVGDRLATVDIGRKVGAAVSLSLGRGTAVRKRILRVIICKDLEGYLS